jgi:hypothetical protein
MPPAMSMGPEGGRGPAGRADLLEAGPVPGGLGGVLGQVMPQVPAVSDLDRGGCSVAGPSAWAPVSCEYSSAEHSPAKVGLTELAMGGVVGQ